MGCEECFPRPPFFFTSLAFFSEKVLESNIGRRDLQMHFIEYKLPTFVAYFSVRGGMAFTGLMHKSQQSAVVDQSAISRMSDLVHDLEMDTLKAPNSMIVGVLRHFSGRHMIDFYNKDIYDPQRKTKLGSQFLSEWGATYRTKTGDSDVKRLHVVYGGIPVYAGLSKDSFLAVVDATMNYSNPDMLTRLLAEPEGDDMKALDVPGLDTAGRLVFVQFSRIKFSESLSLMEWFGNEIRDVFIRANLDELESWRSPFHLWDEMPEFGSDKLRQRFFQGMTDFERNESLRKFFKLPTTATTSVLRPVVALLILFQVCFFLGECLWELLF